MIEKVVLIAFGGAAGALARWGVSKWVQEATGPGFPWGVAAVNLLGCFLFGLIWQLAEERELLSPRLGMIALTGFLGAFTTFSTFAFESVELLQNGQGGLAVANVIGQCVAGLVLVFTGMVLGRVF